MSLLDLQERWIGLFRDMSKNPMLEKDLLAASFLSVESKGYDPINHKSVLYIGKATRGDWFADEFKANPTRDARRATTTRFLQESVMPGQDIWAFWRFGKTLNDQTPTGRDRPFKNIVWSNIAKIGIENGNPGERYLAPQANLAKQTLIAEIRFYRPSLVVFASHNYGVKKIVIDVFRDLEADPEDISWQKPRNDVWWRARVTKLPALLWLNHPDRKPACQLEIGARYASHLLVHQA